MYTLNWQMEHTRVLQVGKNHQDWCDCLVAFFVSFDLFIFEWILVRNTHTQVTGSNIAVEPRTDLCPPQSLLYSSGLSLFASEGSGDEFAGFFNYIPKSIKSHSGITIAMPCLSFWTGTKSWVVPFPGTASQCCAHTSPEQLGSKEHSFRVGCFTNHQNLLEMLLEVSALEGDKAHVQLQAVLWAEWRCAWPTC